MQVLGSMQSTAQVHPEKLTKAMMAAAEARGAQIRLGTVQGITTTDGLDGTDGLTAQVTGVSVVIR